MTNASNSGGSTVDREVEFRYYDALPPALRKELQDAPINAGSASITSFHRQYFGRYDNIEVASMVREWVKGIMLGDSEHGTKALWTWTAKKADSWIKSSVGKDHPQADASYPWPSYQVTPRRKNNTRVISK